MSTVRAACLFALALVLAPLLPVAQYAQLTYGAARCNGSLQMVTGDHVQFVPEYPPGPQAFSLWMLVQQGEGDVLLSDSSGSATDGLYFHAGDLLLFETQPPYDLYFQGGTMRLAYGGAVLGAPVAAVCGTGAQGPVVFKADQRYDTRLQCASAGISVQVASYGAVTAQQSGTLNYAQASGYALQGTFAVPSCSGPACCNPQQAVFPVSKGGTVSYTLYTLTSTPATDFDYALGPPVPLLATATAIPESGAPPLAVSFTGTATGGIAPYTWDWNFGDGSAHKTVQNPNHTYAAGTYHPMLTVEDASGNSAEDTHLTVTVTVPYAASAHATPVQGPAPLAVTFTATVTGGTAPYTYEWVFGDGTPGSAEQNPSHTYSAIGAYHPALTARDSTGAAATDSHLVIQALGPGALSASAQADKTYGLLPLPVAFTGSASGGAAPYTYAWDFGDGSAASSEKDPAHTYTVAGAFTVTLTVHDAGGQSATDDHVRIFAASSFVATASANPSSGPAPLAVQFSAALTGGTEPYTYQWDFGDGTTSSEAAPEHTYAYDGSYPVALVVQDALGQAAVDNRLLIAVGGADVPTITSVVKGANPFRLTVKGANFQPGCLVLIGQTPAPVVSYKKSTQIVAKGGSTLKAMVPKGIPVCVQVRNPGGITSPCFSYTR